MDRDSTRTTAQKIAIFRRRFAGLTDVYGTYDPVTGRVRQIKQPVTDMVIRNHLSGTRPYGVYLLAGDRTRAVVADFDDSNPMPPIEYVRQARHYGIGAYIERSKAKGYHVWVFSDEKGFRAQSARSVVRLILEEIGHPDTEIFPKQDRIAGAAKYGNFINAPLFGQLVPRDRSVFLNPANGLKPYADQWDLLQSVEEVPECRMAEIVEINDLNESSPYSQTRVETTHTRHDLPPCAVHMFQGVHENQRVACFRLAAHLHRLGVPFDVAVAALKAWSARNRPTRGKRVITETEILDQTRSAFQNGYRGYGCYDPIVRRFCDPVCPVLAQSHRDSKGKTS